MAAKISPRTSAGRVPSSYLRPRTPRARLGKVAAESFVDIGTENAEPHLPRQQPSTAPGVKLPTIRGDERIEKHAESYKQSMNQFRLFARSRGAPPRPASALLGGVGLAGGPAKAAPAPTTIGFIYVGPKTDYGYNQAHA